MIVATGEIIETPERAVVSQELVLGMRPLLAGIARKGAALYERALPVAANFYHYANYGKDVSFLPSTDRDALPETGTLRFRNGFESSSIHNFLLVTRNNDDALSIVKDYKVRQGESHIVEVVASPTHSADGYDYGDFSVGIFKRMWSGWPQGRALPEPQLDRAPIASAHVRALNDSIRRANKLVNKEYVRKTTLLRGEAGEPS